MDDGDTVPFSAVEDTVEIPAPRKSFWKKWELWSMGFAMMAVLSGFFFLSIIGAHTVGSDFNRPTVAPAPTRPTPQRIRLPVAKPVETRSSR